MKNRKRVREDFTKRQRWSLNLSIPFYFIFYGSKCKGETNGALLCKAK